MRSAQRTFAPVFHSNARVIRTLCDEQLLLSIQTTLSDGITLNMGEVNGAYLIILKRNHVEVDETTNYRKHLKQPIIEHLPNAQFVKSFRKNEPDDVVLPKTVSKAMEIQAVLQRMNFKLFFSGWISIALLTVFGRTITKSINGQSTNLSIISGLLVSLLREVEPSLKMMYTLFFSDMAASFQTTTCTMYLVL